SSAQWRTSVVEHQAQVLQEHSCHQKFSTSETKGHSKFTPNEVKIINKEHLSSAFHSSQWQTEIAQIARDFDLKKEQEHAYHIIANHSCSENPDQLKMNIAGMAGTGKTQVLLALMHFFALKKETHHLVIVAPTGSTAALLGGSTYHYMFGIDRIDYVFFDEVLMLSCHDMYRISERLAIINNNPENLFGGLSMIFAGDFTQLPPPIGK
ncbi:hypothetical protein L208DRAFT_1286883, partial [Tricholoma matsutake]